MVFLVQCSHAELSCQLCCQSDKVGLFVTLSEVCHFVTDIA